MNTKFQTAAAQVIGARHRRAGRNGQDAAVALCSDDIAVAVVCDGCSSGASSEVGARLGARWFAQLAIARLHAGADVGERALWEGVRAEVGTRLASAIGAQIELAGAPAATDALAIREYLLFTVVAAAMTPDGAAVWALGDGSFAIDGVATRLGPFDNNAPPYLAYDLLAAPAAARFDARDTARRIVVATDGIDDLDNDVGMFGAPQLVAHPDGLRRRLARLAIADERIDWSEQRVVRTPARLQDDLAIAIIERTGAEAA